LLYEIMYFSPVEVGDERHTCQLYFQTDNYNRTWPTSMVDKMSAQIDLLRHVELGIHSFDAAFKRHHRDVVLFHCKMALAYLDAREARIAMKLCDTCEASTTTTESRILQDPEAGFDFLRITMLSVKACAARRVKFVQKAVDALSEAKNICVQASDQNQVHPLMTALTLLNLSAVLGDIDHDEHGLRWGLEALSLMYSLFSSNLLPENVQAYFLTVACHNAALLNVKLGRWADAAELVDEAIEFTKVLGESDDGIRRKLIAIGAQAKHVPEGFLTEAVNALNGWGEERTIWNLSFWDFSVNELLEEIHVLQHTETLQHIIIEQPDTEDSAPGTTHMVDDVHLARFILAIVSCESLKQFTVSGIDFDPRKVWRRIKKRSFLETSWYASALNFTNILERAQKPEVASYNMLMKNLNLFLKKLVLFLITLGNECEGVDLSENGIDGRSITALVKAVRWPHRPPFARQVSKVILRGNDIDALAARELARTWEPVQDLDTLAISSGLKEPGVSPLRCPASPPASDGDLTPKGSKNEQKEEENVTSLDVSQNSRIGDQGFQHLTKGIAEFEPFKVLKADSIGLGPAGCSAVERLSTTSLELLCLSNNQIGSEGAEVISKAAMWFRHLHTLQLDDCGIDGSAAKPFAELLSRHRMLAHISLNHNSIGSEGVIVFCGGAGQSKCLASVHISYNGIDTEAAAEAIGLMMTSCGTLVEMNLSGNHIDPRGAPHIGSAIEHSKVLTMYLEDMGFDEMSIDDFLDHGAAETQDLQVMILNNNPVGDEGLGIIAECLSIGLTDLSLSKCALTSACEATLLNLVSLSPNLRSLDLSDNDLGPSGCSDMVAWMTQNERDNFSLRSLELAGCKLGDDGFHQLVPILGALTYLGVRSNGITSTGLEAVMNSHRMIQLKCLDLANNSIGEKGLHALTERFQQEHKRSLWNPKQLTSTIDQVVLSNNSICQSLAMSTEAFLKIHNPLLTVVW